MRNATPIELLENDPAVLDLLAIEADPDPDPEDAIEAEERHDGIYA